jgi:hypothetical protein
MTRTCPACRSEYREEITTCADCGEPLVLTASLPPEPDPRPLVVIDRFHDLASAQIAVEMLQAAGIEALLKDEQTLGVDWLLGPALGGARLLVRDDQVEEARQLLAAADQGEGVYLGDGPAGLDADLDVAHPPAAGSTPLSADRADARPGSGGHAAPLPPELEPGDPEEEAAHRARAAHRKRTAGLVAILLAVPILAPIGLLFGLRRWQQGEPREGGPGEPGQ